MGARVGVTIYAKNGTRLVLNNAGECIAADQDDIHARAAKFAIEAGRLFGKSVAWIGGGLCVGPRVFAAAECKQTVYEIEPALAEFCPKGIEFVAGDWRTTIEGKFDIIVYDLGDEVPRDTLSAYLAPGGSILPLV
jgi:spermidine synthase